ncbi:MAG TPA: 50S ribosomal protein L11 methyltransferase [Casimicrobiaceae bacterium]|nr:50S ribosomal protein L11 methyltransferase [Casimicrobiaceae bacterium]
MVFTSTFTIVRFDVDAADADRWSDALLDAGALSVEGVDPCAGAADEAAIYDEPAIASPAWWRVTRLTALVAPDIDASIVVGEAARLLDRPTPRFVADPLADRDWVRASRAQFEPLQITERLWIVPTWCNAPSPDTINVMLDPGLAFGTGAHPTTRLCLAWLAENVTSGVSMLDYGCGSGILAITAAKLGAEPVVGVDIDPLAVRATADNANVNGVSVDVMHVDALTNRAFGLVVANILANPLRLLAPALAAHTDTAGRIALSGVLATQANDVARAYETSFDLDAPRRDGEWVLLSGTRRATRSG